MKRNLFLLIITLFWSVLFAQNDSIDIKGVYSGQSIDANNTAFESGVQAYNDGDFFGAVKFFQKEVNSYKTEGMESPELYYNLGNAYFRTNELGKARLYYEKALLLKPNYEDAKFNIKFLEGKLLDRPTITNTFFIRMWLDQLTHLLPSNTWNVIGIVCFLIFIVMVGCFFLFRTELIKKISFYIGVVFLVVCVCANIFSYKQAIFLKNRNEAIVISPIVSVYSTPDTSDKEIFILHQGAKIEITKDDNSWIEIKIDNNTVGWIKSEQVEII